MNNSEVDVGYVFPTYNEATMTRPDAESVLISLRTGGVQHVRMKIDGMYQLLEHARKLKPKDSHDRDTNRVA